MLVGGGCSSRDGSGVVHKSRTGTTRRTEKRATDPPESLPMSRELN